MERELLDVLTSLSTRDAEFREQVEKMRAFKERMKDAGVEVVPNKFKICLADGFVTQSRLISNKAN